MARYDDLNVSRITLVGVIAIVVTAVTALAVQVLFYAMASRTDEAKSAAANYRRENLFLTEQAGELSGYGVDPTTGKVRIPVEKAIEQLLAGEQEQENAAKRMPETTDEA